MFGTNQNGEAGIFALGPLNADDVQAVSTSIFDYSGSTGSVTTPLKGGEVRRYAMPDEVIVSVILNDKMVVVQIAGSGNSAEQDFQTATEHAQLMLDALEQNGLLGGQAPDLEAVITNTAPSSVTGEGVPGGQSAGDNGNTAQNGTDNSAGSDYQSEAPAAIGPVGSIPGPANNTEAVVGVVVPGLVAVAIGALSGLAGSGAPPTGGSTPPVRETGFKRSKFSADETTDQATDGDELDLASNRELAGDENQFPPQEQIFTDSATDLSGADAADEMILEKFKGVPPEDETVVTESDGIVVDTTAIIQDGTILSDDFGGNRPETDILAEDGSRIEIDTSAIDDGNVILSDNDDDILPEEDTILTDGDQVVVDESAFEPDPIHVPGQPEATEIDEQSKIFDETKVSETGAISDDEAAAAAAASNTKQPDEASSAENELNKDETTKKSFDQNGFDQDGYDQDGFDKNGYNKDGYDLQGFDYKGYNRDGFDPFGYDRQGYGKDGFHWSGYNADGYDKSGKSWSDLGYDPEHRNPFDGGPISLDGSPIVDTKPTAPPLGQPYPKTAEKFGPKTWDTPASTPATPVTPTTPPGTPPASTTPTGTPPGQTPSSQPQAIPTDQEAINHGFDGDQTEVPEIPNANSTVPTFPKDGETKTLVGQTDGRTYEIKYDAKSGQWINTESGNYFDPDRFGQWQDDLAVDKALAAETMNKFATRQDATSKAIDQHLADFKNLEQIQKTADKFEFGSPGGPGDVDQAIQDLKDEMIAGKELDHDKLEKIKTVIDSRITGQSAPDSVQKWQEPPWYTDVNAALKANAESIRNIVTGEDEDGNTSYLGMAGRMVIGAATGGSSEYIMTVAEALNNVKKGVDQGKSGWDATTGAMTQVVTDEVLSFGLEKTGELGVGFVKKSFPKATQTLSDLVDAGASKIDDLNQKASKKLGLIADEGADKAVDKINQNMAKKAAQTTDEIGDDATKAAKKSADQATDDLAAKKGLKTGEKPDPQAYQEATQKIKDQKDKVSQKADDLIDDYRKNNKPDPEAIERDEMFKEGRKAGQQKVDELKTAQDQLKANPDSTEAKKAYETAMEKVQQDKHAMHSLNDLKGADSDEIRSAFKTQMNQKAKLADFDARERIAKEYGVDIEQVKTVGATNTMDVSDAPDPTGFAQKPKSSQPLDQIPDDQLQAIKNKQKTIATERAKLESEIDVKKGNNASYDIDKTYRIQVGETVDPVTGKVTKIYKDIPAADTKRVFGEEYYKQFHDGKLPTKMDNGIEVVDSKAVDQFAKEMDVSAVDHRAAEGYGASDADLKEMLKKDGIVKKLGDIEAGTKTMEYKANEWENQAAELRKQAEEATGTEKAQLLARAEGLSEESMRQTTKQFNNQICEQVKAINLAKGQDVVKIPDKLFTAINVMEKVGTNGLSVVEAEEILKGMGMTPKGVSQQMSSLMEAMQKFNK